MSKLELPTKLDAMVSIPAQTWLIFSGEDAYDDNILDEKNEYGRVSTKNYDADQILRDELKEFDRGEWKYPKKKHSVKMEAVSKFEEDVKMLELQDRLIAEAEGQTEVRKLQSSFDPCDFETKKLNSQSHLLGKKLSKKMILKKFMRLTKKM